MILQHEQKRFLRIVDPNPFLVRSHRMTGRHGPEASPSHQALFINMVSEIGDGARSPGTHDLKDSNILAGFDSSTQKQHTFI